MTKEVAESIGLGKPVGALVQGVEPGTPAEKAGIEAGDIIVKVDGKQIDKSGDLPRFIGATKPGSKVSLQLFRRGQHQGRDGHCRRDRARQNRTRTGRTRLLGCGQIGTGPDGGRSDGSAEARDATTWGCAD